MACRAKDGSIPSPGTLLKLNNMNIQKPKVNLTARYSVRETCTILGICRETLRRHTHKGTIAVHYRKANMRPFFLGSDIMAFWNRSI